MSGGTYAQNFDSLATNGTANSWADNSTLPGWYASKSVAPNAIATYRADDGSGNAGALYSFGSSAATNRALGSIASGTPGNFAYGVRFANDTATAQTNFLISYTGEQWRNGGNTSAQMLEFSYRVSSSPITNSDAANANSWTSFAVLNFTTPTTGPSSSALDGNNPANQQSFTNVALTGVIVQPGQEIFFRWFDTNDVGNDHGIAIDNLTIGLGLPPGNSPPVLTAQPQNQAAGEGGFAIFSAGATGNPPPNFQWQFNGTNLPGATNSTLALNNLTANQAGPYSAVVTNSAGATNSNVATLIVTPVSFDATNGEIRILTYNVAGNNSGAGTNAAAWSTNAAQVQAIGRELMYFNPDIITFNEIPTTNGVAQMTNWVKAFLPGYFLATNSLGDSFIQNVIASRFPILSSASHLHGSHLNQYGYIGSSSTNFTRDLFEAQIAVPNWPLPLHVFVAHLKSTGSSNPQGDADKRAAEASAVSNYFAAVYLTGTNATHPYVLGGDMNEDAFFPETNRYTSGYPIQRLTAPPTGLQMTIPVNPVTHTDLTESIQGTLDTRFDYLLPCAVLFSNVAASAVFRTDLLTNFPPNLNSNDDKIASDHLPVLMVFKNPFDTPFKLLSIGVTNQAVLLKWESQKNRSFTIEASTDLVSWTSFATNLAATTTNPVFTFATNSTGSVRFFRVWRAP